MVIVLACFFAFSVSHVETFTVDGVQRQALVFDGRSSNPPLVLAFHGHGGSMYQAARSFDLQDLWPEATIIYPDGLPTVSKFDPKGQRAGWQVRPGTDDDRDLKFVDAILAKRSKVDPDRTFAMGHSNGGAMTYLLLATRRKRFAAFGPSGSPGIQVWRDLSPAPIFAVAGENDPLVPFKNQKLTIDHMAKLDGIDLSRATPKGFTTLASGPNGMTLGTYIFPGGHEIPREAVRAMVAFFKQRLTH